MTDVQPTLASAQPSGPRSTWIELAPTAAEREPRRHQRRRRATERTLAIAVPAVLLVLWEVGATRGWIQSRYFASPSDIVEAWRDTIDSGLYWRSLEASLRRIGLGYGLGAASALVLGMLIGSNRLAISALEPTIVALYTVPKLSILPLLLLIFGLGETTKVLLVALTCFFVILLNTIDAVSSVESEYVDVGRSCGASRLATFRHILLPAALPQIITGMRLAAGLAVIVIVGAEFVAADEGLGYLVWNSWNLGIPERMFVGIVSIACLGVVVNALIRLSERFLTPWTSRST